jgi:hypothetical protein
MWPLKQLPDNSKLEVAVNWSGKRNKAKVYNLSKLQVMIESTSKKLDIEIKCYKDKLFK